jgi:hypothetical protein
VLGAKSYPCPWYLAHLLCPTLRTLTASDPTIDELYLETADPDFRFPDFLSLAREGVFSFQETDRPFLLSITRELGNSDLYSAILYGSVDSPDLATAISRLALGDDEVSRKVDVQFVAGHFDEVTPLLFRELSCDLSAAILCEPGLMLKSEDHLYELIRSRFDDDPRFFGLLEFVHFEYLTVAALGDFLARRFATFEHLTPAIWDQVCRRLALNVETEANPRSRDGAGDSFPFSREHNLRGIITGLTLRHGGNVHDKGIVTVSASARTTGLVSNVVDFGIDSGVTFVTGGVSAVAYDFRERIVTLSGTAFLLGQPIAESAHGFVTLEVSMDGSHWTRLVQMGFTDRENQDGRFIAFETASSQAARFVRLTIYSPDPADEPVSLVSWELYGSFRLRPAPKAASTHNRPDRVHPAPPFAVPHRGGHMPRPVERPRRLDNRGVCGNGVPLPATLNGVATFLSQQAPGNVVVNMHGFALEPVAGMGDFRRLVVHGAIQVGVPAWLDIRFPNHRVRITHYAIIAEAAHPFAGWVISCSVDGHQWVRLDQRTNRDIPEPREVTTFALATPTECSVIRIAVGAPPPRPPLLAGFEIFGAILN